MPVVNIFATLLERFPHLSYLNIILSMIYRTIVVFIPVYILFQSAVVNHI